MSAWSSLNRKVNDLMSTCRQPTEELPQAFIQIATSQQTMSWPLQKAPAMQGMVKSKPGREADEWTQSYAGFQRWQCTSVLCSKGLRGAIGTCPAGTAELWPLPSSPCGHFWKEGGPAVASSDASGLPSTNHCSLPFHSPKLIQTTLFF